MSEDKELRIAVLGVGMMGAFHVDALSKRIRGARVTVVNDFFLEKATEVAAGIGARVSIDPFEAINADDVDAVLIATPGSGARGAGRARVSTRGIPVLCEKPLTTDIDSAYAIVRSGGGAGSSTDPGRFHAPLRRRVRRAEEAHHRWRSGEPAGGALHPPQRRASRTTSTASTPIRDSVVHEVDVARFLLDEEIISVQVISGVATTRAPRRCRPTR